MARLRLLLPRAQGVQRQQSAGVKELAFREETLAAIDTGYLGAYAVGQFLSGLAGDRIGARRLVSAGMLFAAITCAAFGAGSTGIALFLAFTMNGLAQSTGWPGTTKAMAEWTTAETRGSVMGLWCTCYQVGGIAATWFCSWLLGHYGWRSTFAVPALCMAAVGGLVFVTLKPGPNQPRPSTTSSGSRLGETGELSAQSAALELRRRLLLHQAHPLQLSFLAPLLFAYGDRARRSDGWVSFHVVRNWRDRRGHLHGSHLGSTAAPVAIGGGRLGAHRPRGRTDALCVLGPHEHPWPVLAHGAHRRAALRTRLAGLRRRSQDAGGARAATATGLVNGIGSIGGFAQGYVTVGIRKAYGWSALFYVFVALALFSAAALAPTFRRKPRTAVIPAA